MLLCFMISTTAMAQLSPMSKQMAKDLYNNLNGSSWVIINKDGSTKTVTENWLTEIPQRVGLLYTSSTKMKDVKKIDLTNCGLTGDMPENCFTQPWITFESEINANYHRYYNTPRNQNEDNASLVAHSYGSAGQTVRLSHNNITSISRDITAIRNVIGAIQVDHNKLQTLPDFQFTAALGVGGIWGSRGTYNVDFSYNEISNVNKNQFISKHQTSGESGKTGMLSLDNTKLDISNNRLNFTNLIILKELMSGRDAEFTYAPQKPLGDIIEDKIVERGSPVTLQFSLDHPQNEYTWYLNGEKTQFKGKELIISSLTEAQAGVYQCMVTNSLLPDLVIESHPMGVFLKKDDNKAPENISIDNTTAVSKTKAFGFTIGTLTADDDDKVFFMLKGEGYDYSFRILNGKYLVNAEELFDHFSIKEYDITVVAYDIYGGKTEKQLTITRDENMEELIKEMYTEALGEYYTDYNILGIESVFENTKDINENSNEGTNVSDLKLIVKYIDNDRVKTKALTNVSFSLLPINNHSEFKLEGAKLLTANKLNFEDGSERRVGVKFTYAGSKGSIDYSKFLNVRVVNLIEPPKDIVLTSSEFKVNNSLGKTVGYITAIQEDTDYSPVQFTTKSNKFMISGAELKAASVFTHTGTEDIEIICTNKEGQVIKKSFAINIVDNSVQKKVTGIGIDNFLLNKNAVVDDIIANIYADTECEFSCDNEYFKIVGRRLKLKEILDENIKKYSVEIIATTDAGAYNQSFDLYIPSTNSGGETEIIEVDSKSKTKVYPNPVKGILNIEGADRVQIHDGNGRLVHTALIFEGKIDIGNLSDGLYILKLYTETGIETYKVIKR